MISGKRIWNVFATELKRISSNRTDVLRAKNWLEKRGYYVYSFGDWYIETDGYKSWGLTDDELIAFAERRGMEVKSV